MVRLEKVKRLLRAISPYDSLMTGQIQTRYFDNAATSFPKPAAVAEAMRRHLLESGAPARGTYAGARESARLVNQCRARIAKLVNLMDSRGNAAGNQVVFGYNTTDALNLGVKGVLGAARRRWGAGKVLHVVTTMMEHNSILRPLHAMKERDAQIEWTIVAAEPKSGLVDAEDVRRAIRRGETVLVCINHASNVMGTVQDMERIGAVCAEFGAGSDDPDGALLLLDAAQSLGHCAVDMRAMRVDLLAFPGHKGLMGPTGTGGLCIRPGVELRMETIREGGTGSTSELPSQPQMMPEKYEPGSHNTVGIVGLSEGVAWLLERGVEKVGGVREHELELMRLMLELLGVEASGACANASGLRMLGPLDLAKRVGVFSFTHESLSSQEMAAVLEASFGILTRAGLHCAPLVHEMLGTSPSSNAGASGAVRLSLGPFLTGADVEFACGALGAMCREHSEISNMKMQS